MQVEKKQLEHIALLNCCFLKKFQLELKQEKERSIGSLELAKKN